MKVQGSQNAFLGLAVQKLLIQVTALSRDRFVKWKYDCFIYKLRLYYLLQLNVTLYNKSFNILFYMRLYLIVITPIAHSGCIIDMQNEKCR